MEKQRWEQSEKRREEARRYRRERVRRKKMQVHEKEDKLQRNEFDLSLPKVTSVKKSDENLIRKNTRVSHNLSCAEGPTALGSWSQAAGREAQGESWMVGGSPADETYEVLGVLQCIERPSRKTYRWRADGYEEPHPYVLTAGLGFVG